MVADERIETACAEEAARILRGECCGSCAHAGSLTLSSGVNAQTISCERAYIADKSYWHSRNEYCRHWEARTPDGEG